MSDVSIASMPYTLAVPYARLCAAEAIGPRSAEAFAELVALHDAMVKTLTLLALPAYVAGDAFRADVDDVLRSRFFARAASLGDWTELLAALLEAQRTSGEVPAVPELVGFWFKKPDRSSVPSDEAQSLSRFVAARNDWAHLKLARDKAWDEHRPALESALSALSFLGGYHVIVPIRASDAGSGKARVTEALSCRSPAMTRFDTDVLCTQPLSLGDELVLLRDGGRDEIARLYPMIVPEVGTLDDHDDLYVYEKNRRWRLDSSRVVRVDYVAIGRRESRMVDARGPNAPLLSAFTARLGRWLSSEGVGEGESDGFADDALFKAMPAILAASAKQVVGRAVLVKSLAPTARGGVVVLRGPPGAGKTAALAVLATAARPADAVHLVGPDAGRDDPRLVVRALLAQLIAKHKLRRAIPDEHGAALKAWHETLLELAETPRQILVVIDAIDELRRSTEGAPELALVPRACPPGVTFVVSARPGEACDTLALVQNARIVDLPPLGTADALILAKTLAPQKPDARVREAVRASEGNPLVLRSLLDSPAATLPASLEGALLAQLEALEAEVGPNVGLLLSLLAVARSGLSRRDLAELTGESILTVGRVLRALRPWLRAFDDRAVLFHARVREWVVREITRDARPVHARIAGLLATRVEAGRSDAEGDLIFHLASAGKSDDVFAALDGGLLVTKAASSGSPESVRGDLVLATSLADPDLVRASRYALLAAMLARGAKVLARRGIAKDLATHGDPRLAASLARMVDDPRERDACLAEVAVAAAGIDAVFAAQIAEAISDDRRREVATAAIGKARQRPLRDVASSAKARARVAEAMAEGDASLRVRTIAAVSSRLPRERALELLERASELAFLSEQDDVRDALVIVVAEALAPIDARAASAAAEGLPRGPGRVRALVAAGDLPAALAEAEDLPEGELRDRALAEALVAMAKTAPEEVMQLGYVQKIQDVPSRDRVLTALVTATKRVFLATRITDATLRVESLASIGEWDEADLTAREIEDPAVRAAAFERASASARRVGEAARAEAFELEAANARQAIPSDAARGRALREASALKADPRAAESALEGADLLDTTYEGARDSVVRRARLAFSAPSGVAVKDAIGATAAMGDAFFDIFPDFAVALTRSFGDAHPEALEGALSALDWAESAASAIFSAGSGAKTPEAPAPLESDVARAIFRKPWASGALDELTREADRLERKLRASRASAAEVEHLVELRLLRADRPGAVGALMTWALFLRLSNREGEARSAELRARFLDPTDPRVNTPLDDAASPKTIREEERMTAAPWDTTVLVAREATTPLPPPAAPLAGGASPPAWDPNKTVADAKPEPRAPAAWDPNKTVADARPDPRPPWEENAKAPMRPRVDSKVGAAKPGASPAPPAKPLGAPAPIASAGPPAPSPSLSAKSRRVEPRPSQHVHPPPPEAALPAPPPQAEAVAKTLQPQPVILVSSPIKPTAKPEPVNESLEQTRAVDNPANFLEDDDDEDMTSVMSAAERKLLLARAQAQQAQAAQPEARETISKLSASGPGVPHPSERPTAPPPPEPGAAAPLIVPLAPLAPVIGESPDDPTGSALSAALEPPKKPLEVVGSDVFGSSPALVPVAGESDPNGGAPIASPFAVPSSAAVVSDVEPPSSANLAPQSAHKAQAPQQGTSGSKVLIVIVVLALAVIAIVAILAMRK